VVKVKRREHPALAARAWLGEPFQENLGGHVLIPDQPARLGLEVTDEINIDASDLLAEWSSRSLAQPKAHGVHCRPIYRAHPSSVLRVGRICFLAGLILLGVAPTTCQKYGPAMLVRLSTVAS
jgi:hypothetical protein